ncbi:WD40/YVTN/BNR-like repeat-containing protein [Kaistella gelatinilytica]|uniref:WD40/YVTN/BNR-like repeat-containing protein n=1 Tax=Kaistella gelatinilytica TaxID=2787636 RepID=UPI001E328C78|nr:glycosyl hydrolase [Kaistella gelatinilytica]
MKDQISIRALQIYDGKVWYSGTDSKFGYVSLKDSADKMQMRLSEEKLEFRTLAQDSKQFYAINILSPAYLFAINKKSLKYKITKVDTAKTAFFDAFIFDKFDRGIAISDPMESGNANPLLFFKSVLNPKETVRPTFPKYFPGEAHFAASNTNIAMNGDKVWIATGGTHSRIFKFSWSDPMKWEAFETPFVQGTSSTGIYSIDFYDKNFGIAVGGDYTKQAENIDNIATTNDGGKTWQIQASGKNTGYKTCVKFRPKSKGKDIIAVGDQNIEFSSDYGKTWKTISEEKGLYVCQWIDQNTVVFAGKNRIVKMKIE